MSVAVRPLVPEDAPALRAIREHPGVRRWWGRAEDDFPLSDEPEVERRTVLLHGRVVGMVQFGEELEPRYRSASVDAFLDPAVRGRGHGPAALELVVDELLGPRGHHRLTIDPAVANVAAIRAYAKVGFRPVGVLRRYERDEEDPAAWHDGLLMELLADERGQPHPHPSVLEHRLLDPFVRRDRAALEALLHPDFEELGASGRRWTRTELIDALVADEGYQVPDVRGLRSIVAGADAALVVYETPGVSRSSLWLRVDGRWRLRRHQASVLPEPRGAQQR